MELINLSPSENNLINGIKNENSRRSISMHDTKTQNKDVSFEKSKGFLQKNDQILESIPKSKGLFKKYNNC